MWRRWIGAAIVAACAGALAPAALGAPPGRSVTQPISTAVGEPVPGAALRYRYPAGTLSDDFEPPAWLGTASTGCRARLTVLAPTVQDAVAVGGRPLTRGHAFVAHRAGGRRVGAVRVSWVLTAGTFGGTPVVSLTAAIRVPAALRPYGAIVAFGLTADTVAAGDGDRPCPKDARRGSALLRARDAADSMIRGVTLVSPPA